MVNEAETNYMIVNWNRSIYHVISKLNIEQNIPILNLKLWKLFYGMKMEIENDNRMPFSRSHNATMQAVRR